MSCALSISGAFGSSYPLSQYSSPQFLGDYSLLTELLDRGEYQTILGDQELFLAAYCMMLAELLMTEQLESNLKVCIENGKIKLYIHGNEFLHLSHAIEEWRQFFLEALKTGRTTEIHMVPSSIYDHLHDYCFFIRRHIDLDSREKMKVCRFHSNELSRAALVVDIRKTPYQYLKLWYDPYIEPVLPKLAQLCGFDYSLHQGKQTVGYIYTGHDFYDFKVPVESVRTKVAEVKAVFITHKGTGNAQGQPSMFHVDALRVYGVAGSGILSRRF